MQLMQQKFAGWSLEEGGGGFQLGPQRESKYRVEQVNYIYRLWVERIQSIANSALGFLHKSIQIFE